MTFVTEDTLDKAELQALRSGDHARVAARLEDLAEEMEGGEVSRAEVLVRAAGQWMLAGQAPRAVELFQHAIDNGGAVRGDVRADLAEALFESDRADEARALLARIRADHPRDPETCHKVADTLEAQGDLEGAHEWASAGLTTALNAENTPAHLVDLLLRARYRVRHDMGLSDDEYDRMLDDNTG
ncbi:MAG: tetratricopeptide repeat protein [Streptosporangiaceae bacterium]